MNTLLLAYIACVLTVYATQEWRSARDYRSYVKPLWTDIQEVLLLAEEVKQRGAGGGQEVREIVARGDHPQHDPGQHSELGESDLSHDLRVRLASDNNGVRA